MVQTKLFSDLHLTKFLDTSAKPFFRYINASSQNNTVDINNQ